MNEDCGDNMYSMIYFNKGSLKLEEYPFSSRVHVYVSVWPSSYESIFLKLMHTKSTKNINAQKRIFQFVV